MFWKIILQFTLNVNFHNLFCLYYTTVQDVDILPTVTVILYQKDGWNEMKNGTVPLFCFICKLFPLFKVPMTRKFLLHNVKELLKL